MKQEEQKTNEEIKNEIYLELKKEFGLSAEDIDKVFKMESDLLKSPPSSLTEAMKTVEKHSLNIPQLIYQVVSLTGTNQVLIQEIQKLNSRLIQRKEEDLKQLTDKAKVIGFVPKEEPKKPTD